MKNLFWNFTIFIALVFTFSSLTGCPTATTETGSVNDAGSNSKTTDTKKKDDDYPSAPAAIAQAEIPMLDGATFKLEDQKGKVILFNLWGIWCGPCIAEIPHLREMQEKYGEKGFDIVGLNVGDENGRTEAEENIKEFVEKKQLNYKIGYADRKLFDEFSRVAQMPGVPISVLVNRDGKMTGIFSGGGPRVINKMKETVEKTVNE